MKKKNPPENMELPKIKVEKIGWLASIMAIIMFCSYLDQIRLNLSGQIGSILLPSATVVNCFAWISYAFLKQPKDWPIISCNLIGLILGIITVLTAL